MQPGIDLDTTMGLVLLSVEDNYNYSDANITHNNQQTVQQHHTTQLTNYKHIQPTTITYN